METGYTIVVANRDALTGLCGANDANLGAIEEFLGAPVVTRGNELTVASSDPEICRKFQLLVDAVMTGSVCLQDSGELVSTVINSLKSDDPARFTEAYIQIPQAIRRVYPKSVRQAELMRALQNNEMVICQGPAGTGKTFIAVAYALKLLLSRQVRKIVVTRPVVEAGESLGFLPGDLEQKINPYLRPIRDAMDALLPPDVLRKIEDSSMLEVAPLAYMRGRSLNNAVVLLDEAQNTTTEQMKMFLTRLGENSRAIITGDTTQVDLPHRCESGLVSATRILSAIPEISIISLESSDVVRNPLVQKIVQAYEQIKQ
ncbi:MAG: PhoH-like protein [Spirochaetes bacterium ADurb.Bin215]|nr:MAG: PhoH-like protein [Spirochaetes bacterium ADurb.Bin215]